MPDKRSCFDINRLGSKSLQPLRERKCEEVHPNAKTSDNRDEARPITIPDAQASSRSRIVILNPDYRDATQDPAWDSARASIPLQ
jgi:hypothetical protein